MTVAPTEQYHLIVSIVNTGQFDQVMEAAKKLVQLEEPWYMHVV